MNQWLIYGFYTHVNVICKALACQNVCSFFVVFVCTFFLVTPFNGDKRNEESPKKKARVTRYQGNRVVPAPWNHGKHRCVGGLQASVEWHAAESTAGGKWGLNGLMSLALLANKNDPKTKTNILYRWNVFFISGDGRERNTIRKYSTSWVWLFQKKQSL